MLGLFSVPTWDLVYEESVGKQWERMKLSLAVSGLEKTRASEMFASMEGFLAGVEPDRVVFTLKAD